MSGSAVTIDIIYCNSGILIFVGGAFLNYTVKYIA